MRVFVYFQSVSGQGGFGVDAVSSFNCVVCVRFVDVQSAAGGAGL